MKKEQLSKRLQRIASYVETGAIVADIGTDHAQLPVYLIEEKISPYIVAGEVNEGPYEAAKSTIEKHHLQHKIKLKRGDGLQVIQDEKVDNVIIAGMGGPLIAQILEEGKEKLNGVSRLILQPNIASEHIRKWFIKEKWMLKEEDILEEDGHIYEILVAEKGDPFKPYSGEIEKEIWLGPFLLKEKDDIFSKKWQRELRQLEIILSQLENAEKRSEEIRQRKREIEEKINWLREELT